MSPADPDPADEIPGVHIGVTPWIPWGRAPAPVLDGFLQQVELAEELGFHSFWLPESHFVGHESYPAPLLLLAMAAARTRRLRLGTTSYLLPIRHPLLTAEEVSVLDQLSGGRVILGIGRGFRPALFKAFEVPPSEKRDRFQAALERILGAWRGEPVAHLRANSDDASGAPVVLAPLPHQRPHPPVWVAAFGPKALAQAGSLDLPYLASPLEPLSQLVENLEIHRQARPSASRDTPLPVPVIRTVFVTNDATCAARVREALTDQARALSQLRPGALGRGLGAALEEWALTGSPAEVESSIERYRQKIGLTHLIARIQVQGASPNEITESLHLLAGLHRDVASHR